MPSAAKPVPTTPVAIRVVANEWALRDGLEVGEERAGTKHEGEPALAAADLVLLLVGPDDRPLQGVAGFIDWRSDGRLTRLLSDRAFVGEWGERLLCPETSDLPFGRMVMLGTGRVGEWREDSPRELARELVTCARKLRARTVSVGWFEEDTQGSPWSQAFDAVVELLRSSPVPAPEPDALGDMRSAPELEPAGLGEPEPASDAEPGEVSPPPSADADLPQSDEEEAPREPPGDSLAAEVEPGAAFAPVEGEDAPESTLGAVEAGSEPEQWWIIAPEALCTRLRGRILGTPRVAELP